MNVSDIKKKVRWCVDEESGSTGDYEDTYFDNIVEDKIGAALNWCALYADTSLLNGDSSFIKEDTLVPDSSGIITPSSKPVLRITRVRATGWNKAVKTLISEDSDEYLMQSDETAMATADRPVAALVETQSLKVQLFPTGTSAVITYVTVPTFTSGVTSVSIPTALEQAFIYYLAYLVMLAHTDTVKAESMLAVAREHLGIQQVTANQ